jgi:hypothetical protein
MFPSRCSGSKKSFRRSLAHGFERLEGREMLSGNPAISAAASDPDGELEAVANVQLRSIRNFMAKTLYDLTQMPESRVPTMPMVTVYGGSLLVAGSSKGDVIQVEEHPQRYDQKLKKNIPAQYVVSIRGPGVPRDFDPDPIPVDSVGNHTVIIFGVAGNDTIKFVTASPSDTIVYVDGGKGADTITGGPNADFLDGGVGDDLVDNIHGGKGDDLIAGAGGKDLLFGDEHADLMFGETGNDVMRGGSGEDEMYGGDDEDQLFGDSENDLLFGGKHFDRLNGERGTDYLSGGQDGIADELVGGDHIDRFRFEGSKANNRDKPRPPEDKELIVGSYAEFPSRVVDARLKWVALDINFELLDSESLRTAKRFR